MEEYLTHPQQQLPAQLSTFAPDVDGVYNFIYWVSVVSFVGVMAAMIYFMVQYRAKPGVKAKPPGHADALEVFWTVAPTILLVMMFVSGFRVYIAEATPPDDSYNVRVKGRQWAWTFEHPNGASEDNVLHVPAGRPVRLVLSSDDVIHSFFVPEFRVKRDAVPGMFSALWFQAIERPDLPLAAGESAEPDARREWYRAQVYCTEYCGAGGSWGDNQGHATMYAQIIVQRPQDFDQWLANPPKPMCGDHECSDEEWGEQLFASKGCTACHSREEGAPRGNGPNFYALAGRQEAMTNGQTVTVDADYLRQSIMEPRALIVEGYNPIMPNIPMSDQQLNALVTYLMTLE